MNSTITIPTWLLVVSLIAALASSAWLAYRAAFWRDMVDILVKTVKS